LDGVTFSEPFPATPEPPGTVPPDKRAVVYFTKRLYGNVGYTFFAENDVRKSDVPAVVIIGRYKCVITLLSLRIWSCTGRIR